jgi:hypothetical protein
VLPNFILAPALILGWIYIIIELAGDVQPRCCWHLIPERGSSKERIPLYGDDLPALAVNPQSLWMHAVLKLASELQELTGVELMTAGSYLKALNIRGEILLLAALVRKCGIAKGVKVFIAFRRLVRSYPADMREALNACREVINVLRVARDGCGKH